MFNLFSRSLIAVILVSTVAFANETPKFSSHYTPIKRQCSYERGSQVFGIKPGDGDIPYTCPPFKGYQASIDWSAENGCLNLRPQSAMNDEGETESQQIACDRGTSLINRTLEWRLANGEPFAVILRYTEWDEKDFSHSKNLGKRLAVKGLTGFESIDATIDVKESNANKKAQQYADEGYAKALQNRQ